MQGWCLGEVTFHDVPLWWDILRPTHAAITITVVVIATVTVTVTVTVTDTVTVAFTTTGTGPVVSGPSMATTAHPCMLHAWSHIGSTQSRLSGSWAGANRKGTRSMDMWGAIHVNGHVGVVHGECHG